MAEEHKDKWDLFKIENPTLSDNDPDFDNWYIAILGWMLGKISKTFI